MAEFSENRHISNLINMSCKVYRLYSYVVRKSSASHKSLLSSQVNKSQSRV